MIKIRKANERGHFDHGWLDTYHTFSFADYHDLDYMRFGSLRVINEDRVKGGEGFPTHHHENMEIITYIIEGALEHKDSMGTGSVIRAGDIQRMSAGTGVEHSEFNPSPTEPVHLLQIWIYPRQKGLTPSYEQKNFSDQSKHGQLRLLASPKGESGSVTIHQDALVYATVLDAGEKVTHPTNPKHQYWIQIVKGSMLVNGTELNAGDGAAITEEKTLTIRSSNTNSEALLFDLV